MRERTLERAFDLALAASVASWGVLRIASAPAVARFSPVTLTIALLNLCVAVLFVARAPAVIGATPRGIIASLPSVIAAGIALRLAPSPDGWSRIVAIAFAIGGVITVASLATLGRSFAIFPARRGVVTRGLYRVVRHPAYVGELVMVAAACAARADAIAIGVGIVAVIAACARVVAEERVLAHDDAYVAYARTVRWRFVPGIW